VLSAALILSFIGGVMYSHVEDDRAVRFRSSAILISGVAAVIALILPSVGSFGYPRQAHALDLAEWLKIKTPPSAVVGTMNSGIVGYFSERQVVNLDGVVNHRLGEFRKTRTSWTIDDLVDYLKLEKIEYIADFDDPAVPTHRSLRPLHVADDFWVYRVIPDE
jgi:hypothetical protein